MRNTTEEGLALLCIPDISGFTRFMVETDLEFSKKIIPALLRNLVASNELNLKLGEIEGDAILFYRFGALPSFKELIEQCKTFYFKFNDQLKQLEKDYPDDFSKYVSPNNLSLKIILHAAEMTSTHIGGITKLLGEDVVVAHKLLKNKVPDNEYILLSEKLLLNYLSADVKEYLDWHEVKESTDEYEHLGTVKYKHISLTPLNGINNKL